MNTNITSIEGGDGLPAEPDWSQIFTDPFDLAQAHEQWGVVTRELHAAGVLSVANGHSIRRLVEMRIQYERSARHVAEKGAILAPTSKKAKTGQWNPHWSVMRQADESIRVLEAELGLAPTRRGKTKKVERAKQSKAADRYIGRGR